MDGSIKISCWNAEDFVAFTDRNPNFATMQDQLKNNEIMDELRQSDIILIQEWNTNGGDSVYDELNKFDKLVVDRTAIFYDRAKFTNPSSIAINLPHEPPHLLEKVYTSGRQKQNIFGKVEYNGIPIFICCFHLSAFVPRLHKDFHKRQLTGYLKNCLSSDLFKNNWNIPGNPDGFGFIIGGDTNFNDGTIHENLMNVLLEENTFNLLSALNLKDVCEGNCSANTTQNFSCTHENDLGKKMMRQYSKYKESKSKLDFLAVNEMFTKKTSKIVDICYLSDHSLITSDLQINNEISIDKQKIKDLINNIEHVPQTYNSNSYSQKAKSKSSFFSMGGKIKNKKTKKQKIKNKKTKKQKIKNKKTKKQKKKNKKRKTNTKK